MRNSVQKKNSISTLVVAYDELNFINISVTKAKKIEFKIILLF